MYSFENMNGTGLGMHYFTSWLFTLIATAYTWNVLCRRSIHKTIKTPCTKKKYLINIIYPSEALGTFNYNNNNSSFSTKLGLLLYFISLSYRSFIIVSCIFLRCLSSFCISNITTTLFQTVLRVGFITSAIYSYKFFPVCMTQDIF